MFIQKPTVLLWNNGFDVISGFPPEMTQSSICGIIPTYMHIVPCRFVTGVISSERLGTFERVLWRACRGNVFLRQAEIFEPLEDPTSVRTSTIRVKW